MNFVDRQKKSEAQYKKHIKTLEKEKEILLEENKKLNVEVYSLKQSGVASKEAKPLKPQLKKEDKKLGGGLQQLKTEKLTLEQQCDALLSKIRGDCDLSNVLTYLAAKAEEFDRKKSGLINKAQFSQALRNADIALDTDAFEVIYNVVKTEDKVDYMNFFYRLKGMS